MEAFAAARAAGKSSYYLVAPPGAGKTLMGLLAAEAIGRPARCLSPNAAIQQQWLARLAEHWFCLEPDAAERPSTPPASAEAGDKAQALIALTYQRISVRGEGEQPHRNVLRLHEQLHASGVGTVILDECHHLSEAWGRACTELCSALGDPFVVGLTATPVEQDDGPMVELLGSEADHAISLPSVVRSGDLAPYQDLCYVVAPSVDEERDLAGDLARFEALYARLDEAATEGERFSLAVWCDGLELEPRGIDGEARSDLVELYRDEPELVTAWCRVRFARDREPSVDLPYAPEFYEPPTLLDRLQLAAAYCAAHLLGDEADPALGAEAAELLTDWGFVVRAGRIRRRPGRIARRLGFSRQKLEASLAILRTEMAALDSDLRVLVLTDFENPPEGRGALSCVDVMKLMTATEDVDTLDPIMLTGKSLLVDDDLWQRFAEGFEGLRSQKGWRVAVEPVAEEGYWRIRGEGPDWGTRVQVELVTTLFERGLSRCLIGTRALLGEGWDCLRLNTLIDLTVVTSGVAVNQIRGRTLRRDPDNPVKLANNWDVLCLSALGEGTDLQRLRDKYQRFYGVTDDGLVERGIGHLHAGFGRVSVADLFREREQLNATMVRRAQDRMAARGHWRIGETFADRELQVLSFRARPRRPRAPPAANAVKETRHAPPPPSHVLVRREARAQMQRDSALALGGGVVGVGAAVLAALLWAPPLAGLAALPVLASAWWLRRQASSRVGSLEEELASLAGVLLAARDSGEGVTPELGQRDDGTLRVRWRGVEDDEADRLSAGLAELLGPVLSQRYLLVEQLQAATSASRLGLLVGARQRETRVYPVPRLFAQRREAERLLAAWQQRRTAAVELVHTRTPEGRALVNENLYQRPLDGEAAIRTVWR